MAHLVGKYGEHTSPGSLFGQKNINPQKIYYVNEITINSEIQQVSMVKLVFVVFSVYKYLESKEKRKIVIIFILVT
jgi:hypothetical protein